MKVQKMKVKLTLLEPQLGTVPKNPEVYAAFIATKAAEQKGEEEVLTVPKMEEKGWTGFHQDDDGIFIYDYMVRGFLKNAANVLKDQLKLKNARSKIDQLVFVFPRRIHFKRNGKSIAKPDGVLERPLRAQTMQGPRVTLARSDYVSAGATLEFDIHVIGNEKEITPHLVESLFDYSEYCGLGQFRNGSYGRCKAEVKS